MKIFDKYEEKIKDIISEAEQETGEKVSWINVKHGKTVGFQPTAKCSVEIKIKE